MHGMGQLSATSQLLQFYYLKVCFCWLHSVAKIHCLVYVLIIYAL